MPRKKKPNPYTVPNLKAMPLAARYDAIRACVENSNLLDEDTSLRYDLAPLIFRRTPGKPKDGETEEQRVRVCYGRADRWNFKQPPYEIGDMHLPPSLKASSPDALYRLLHFVQPKKLVSPMDYYKGGIFRFFSPERRYLCWVAFHKCEVELSFYCPREDLFIPVDPPWPEALRVEPQTQEEADNWYKPGGGWEKFITQPDNHKVFMEHREAQDAYQNQGIVVPWSSGRMRCKREAGQAWMNLIVTIASTPQDIYPGNSFTV